MMTNPLNRYFPEEAHPLPSHFSAIHIGSNSEQRSSMSVITR